VLDLDLELVTQEGAVGDFSVDIVAKDLGRDRKVIIENQLEATDHSHMGQLITYAAGIDASVVIWVSRQFREEQRQALDWLNRSGADTEYFGVVLELLQVDSSKPAVNFRLVASPNNWSRAAKSATGEVSGKSVAYRKFFQKLIDELREKHKFTAARVGPAQNWYSYSTGTRGFTYSSSFTAKGQLRAEVYIDFGVGHEDTNEKALEALRASSADIETAFGEKLSWEPLDTRRACRVACYRQGSIEDSDESLETYLQWMVDRLLKFKKVFGPRLPGVATSVMPAESTED
jgi:hypothetical protein